MTDFKSLDEAIYIATESGKEMAQEFKELQDKLEFSNRLNKQLDKRVEKAEAAANKAERKVFSVGTICGIVGFMLGIAMAVRK